MPSKSIQRNLERSVAVAEERSASQIRTLQKALTQSMESNQKLENDVRLVVAERVDLGTAVFGPPLLPLELLVAVGEFLAGNDHYATLANLSASCHAVRTEMIYLIVDKTCARLVPSDLSTLAVDISCNDASDRVASGRSAYYHRICATVSAIVSVSTLEHLIHLSSARRRRNGYRLIYQAPVELEKFEVLACGRITYHEDHSIHAWSFLEDATLKFVDEKGNRAGLEETMQYLFRGFPIRSPHEASYMEEQFTPRMLLLGNASLFDVFIKSLVNFEMDDPAILRLMTIKLVHHFFGGTHMNDVALTFSLSGTIPGPGAKFILEQNHGSLLYQQTDFSLSNPFEDEFEGEWQE
ncbi:hypothetical protein QFC21_006054 [Naganishia friedmannii]|uniref:Uncharacterized protein n=1 Tax=Naganishia friedmannii TaxID=89922 RepID=A0ACC2V538_9TREE|nr:hypothetical protein QFC21_006054 [Naganishia friedmannii]